LLNTLSYYAKKYAKSSFLILFKMIILVRIIFFYLLFLISGNCIASPVYHWEVKRVIDGDTLEVKADFLPEELNLSVRILGIDTPEKTPRAKCQKEDELAQKASKFTKKLIDNAAEIVFSNLKWDKYGGRVLANVNIDGVNLGKELIDAGLAREYRGKKKKSWCKKG
jgi:endonuclease YncB( thermonuclease family)